MEFFKGRLELNGVKKNVIVFPNDYKQHEKHPDFMIYESVEGVKGDNIGALWKHESKKQESED